MRKRSIVVFLLGLLLSIASFTAAAADRVIVAGDPVDLDGDGLLEITISTPLVDYLFSENGGVLRSLYLTFAPYGSTVEELVPGTRTDEDTLVRQYVEGVEFPFSLQTETVTDGAYVLQELNQIDDETLVISFVGTVGEATVTKQYTIDIDAIYVLGVQVFVENPSSEPIELTMTLGTRSEGGDDLQYLFDGEPGTDRLAPGSYASFGGIGYMSKAIVFFLSPLEGGRVRPVDEALESGSRRFGVSMVAESGSSSYDFSLYGGRRRFLMMKDAGLEKLDDPGIGARLMIPVIQFLTILYRATGNYGWAIILFTILTRVILFPVMRKQYRSMAKMQQLQPKMKRIQERFKDDKQLQQQKVMELYQKEGVNPMSGCLPLLIQLPILVLIWRAILYSGEYIRLSPSFLWIPDLSMSDPYFILVIVTTVIMILQQWLMTPSTSTDSSGTQKYFGYLFPVLMAFMLWRFPAGLWLYYLLTTATQVAQQWVINREMAGTGPKPAPAVEIDDEIEADDDTGDAGANEGS